MHTIVHVHVHVKPEFVEAFKEASRDNMVNSRLEPGIAGFDVYQQADDPARFVFIEQFRTPEARAAHRDTAHYQRWRGTVEAMMAEPRQGRSYVAI